MPHLTDAETKAEGYFHSHVGSTPGRPDSQIQDLSDEAQTTNHLAHLHLPNQTYLRIRSQISTAMTLDHRWPLALPS